MFNKCHNITDHAACETCSSSHVGHVLDVLGVVSCCLDCGSLVCQQCKVDSNRRDTVCLVCNEFNSSWLGFGIAMILEAAFGKNSKSGKKRRNTR